MERNEDLFSDSVPTVNIPEDISNKEDRSNRAAAGESKTFQNTERLKKHKNSLDDVVQRIVDLFHYITVKTLVEPEILEWAKKNKIDTENSTLRFQYYKAKKREEVEIAGDYLKYALTYIDKLQEKLKERRFMLVVVGGYAAYLYSKKAKSERSKNRWFKESYNTQDIDLKLCRAQDNDEDFTINQLRGVLDQVIKENKKIWPGILGLYDPTNILIRSRNGNFEKNSITPENASQRENPNLPLKITAPIATSFKKKGASITEPIVEITFSNTELPDDIVEMEGLPLYSARGLIENLMKSSENFVERIQMGERNLYMGKLVSWYSQLRYLVRYESEKKYKSIGKLIPSIDLDVTEELGAAAASADPVSSRGGYKKKISRKINLKIRKKNKTKRRNNKKKK